MKPLDLWELLPLYISLNFLFQINSIVFGLKKFHSIGLPLLAPATVLMALVASGNVLVYFRCRGKHYKRFLHGSIVWGIVAAAPGVFLFLEQYLKSFIHL